jgi:hypothetical protein
MNAKSRKSLVATNAMIWVCGILASFILPMIAKGMVDGPGNFLQMLTHGGPLFVAMLLSTAIVSKAAALTVD